MRKRKENDEKVEEGEWKGEERWRWDGRKRRRYGRENKKMLMKKKKDEEDGEKEK